MNIINSKGIENVKKRYLLIFENENLELHKKVKSTAPLLEETINEFIMIAIRERIEKIESQKLIGK